MTSPGVLPSDTKQSGVRTVGSNYTTFQYQGKPIAYLEGFQDSGQRALSNGGAGYEFIHPLGYEVPTDIVTSRVLDGGTLTLSIRELWNQEVWEQLQGLTGTKTIVDIFKKLAQTPQYVTCTKIITPPSGSGSRYGKIYHRCTIVNAEDGETVQIGALSVAKTLTIAYTHTTKL
jgi:hypothetical protein